MVKKSTTLIIALIVMMVSIQLQAQVAYEVRTIQDITTQPGFLLIDIEIRSTGATPFQMGTSAFVFNYNTSALTAATLAGARKVSANDGPWDATNDDDYTDVGTSAPSPGIISLIVDVSGTGSDATGPVVPASFTRVGTLKLTINNTALTSQLSWRNIGINTGVQMFANPGVDYSMTDITANGTFIAATDDPLPVELTSFNAIARGRNVELTWNTATETNNAGFEVERKVEGTEWTKVGFVEGNGTTAFAHSYSYTDKIDDINAYSYRLKQIDRDGNFSYSGEVEVTTALTSADYSLSANYPNPFNPTTKFTFAVQNNEQVAVKVFNSIGQEVATLFNGVASANTLYEMNFNATGLASGTYFYMLRSNGRFEIKKMMLMK
jgi:hypothetical protein